MSDRKLAQKLQPILKQVWKLSRRLTKASINWLLRTVFLLNRRPRVAGFVLPTTVFLILVVSLTVGALTFRSFNSTTRTIANVQSREIYNAATPAIDRARAKLDYLFGKDNRLPSGTPSEEFIIAMLLNEATRPIGANGVVAAPLPVGTNNPYTLEGETRIDINGSGVDNAWVYEDGDNVIVYSINFSTPDTTDANKIGPVALLQLTDQEKANGVADNGTLDGKKDGPYVRSGPQSNSSAVKCRTKGGGSKVEGGWFQDVSNTSILRKRFQVDAFVVSKTKLKAGNPVNFTTLEFLQDYKLDRGNKWGAWFKYDLEAVSGAPMNWNGAMHSEGNIFMGRAGGSFNSFLISATKSCLFKPESNSEISVREFVIDPSLPPDHPKQVNGGVAFKGIIASAELGQNTGYQNGQRVDKYDGGTFAESNIDTGKDWATETKDVIGISTDPVKLLTEDIQQARSPNVTNLGAIVDPLKPTDFNPGRFASNPTSNQPYVDDTYRADNRYGPKVRYNKAIKIPSGTPGKKVGDNITDPPELINDPTPTVLPGLDGYWERRTFKDGDTSTSKVYTGGMRILVGERLELGNPYGWVAPQDRPAAKQDLTVPTINPEGNGFDNLRSKTYTAVSVTDATLSKDNSDDPGDPLYPPYAYTGTANANRKHETKQRRALRDNLAAVQAATVYHYGIADGRAPAACLALTAHPGSPYTLRQSVNFSSSKATGGSDPLVDFFYGKGTNGWEFKPPDITSTAMQTALANLANFAGDYNSATKVGGAFPPTQDGKIHPDPTLTMWGNFSNLKRSLEAGNGSPADQTYQETAGCMLGMLAYNINQVQNFNPSAASPSQLKTLADDLRRLMDGKVDEANGYFEVLPPSALATYDYGASPTFQPAKYNPRDYDRVTPDMFLATLREQLQYPLGPTVDLESDPSYARYQLGLLIHEHYQIRRDRTFGFRPSSAANTWNYNPYLSIYKGEYPGKPGIKVATLWSSACDPHIFPVTGATKTGKAGAIDLDTNTAAGSGLDSFIVQQRLALSRLCGTVIPPGAVHDFPGDNNYPSQAAVTPIADPPPILRTFLEDVDNDPTTPELEVAPPATPTTPTSIDKFKVVGGSAGATSNAVFAPLAQAPYDKAAYTNYKRALVAPKFPSLYYIFPEFNHDQDGGIRTVSGKTIDHRQPENDTDVDAVGKKLTDLPAAFRPWKEPYLAVANAYPYQVVSATSSTPPNIDEDYGETTPPFVSYKNKNLPGDITSFKYKPLQVFVEADKSIDLGVTPKSIGDWALPTIADPAATAPNPNRVIAPDGKIQAIPFQDKVVFNGREWLPTRALDIDLDMLRTSGKGVGNDTWLPVTGIVYAFREDAVREDGIARPASGTYTDATTPGAETDPPLNATFNVSTKPVDYIADPDRRPHGFRLRNGAVLKREGVPKDDNFHGLSFISDQPVYIMGNFNLHQETPGGTRLEEFKVQLPATPAYTSATFYDNRDANDTDPRFADPDQDLWRPSEILADSVSILSDRFCDGSAIDTFMSAAPRPTGNQGGIGENTSSGSDTTKQVYTSGSKKGAQVYNDTDKALFGSAEGCLNDETAGATSFLNQNRPMKDLPNVASPTLAKPQWDWVRENPGDPIYSPVKISRNGNGLIAANSPTNGTSVPVEYSSANDTDIRGEYMDNKNSSQSDARALQKIPQDTETGVNVIMVSGVVPAQKFQGYGALSNFPRFLENWDDGKTNLRFAGSFLQLNFSNYATGPFDDDSWEPGEAPIPGKEVLPYRPPARLWGYDVGLQLAQASPAASRFTTLSNEKNEFYSEPPGSDAYMKNLCLSLKNQPPAGFDPKTLNCPT